MSAVTGNKIQLAAVRACFAAVDHSAFPAAAALMGFEGLAVDQCIDSPLPIAVLTSATGFTGVKHGDAEAAHRIRHLIDQAGDCGCKLVEFPDAAGNPSKVSPLAIGDWLLPLADYAAGKGVTLAVMNGSIVRTVSMMWNLLERADHPAIGCSWDIDQARRWGESPGVSVPVLGSRIVIGRFGRMDDATRQFIYRLRGIGFSGWLVATSRVIAVESAMGAIREWLVPKKVEKPASKKPATPRPPAGLKT